jgi:hypothetical protein
MTTTTQLTPNSQSVVTMTNTTATVQFQIEPADMAYWSPTVTTSFVTVINSSNKGNNVVTFNEGLTVTLSPQSNGSYSVLLSGNITDSGDTYPIVGAPIGNYTATKSS